MSESDGWEARMAERTAARTAEHADTSQRPDRSTWPVPDELKGYSGRDVLLWYIMDGWRRILGGAPQVVVDNDFGYHVLSDGIWQLTLVSLEQFPGEEAMADASRCGSCDHLTAMHRSGGCWYTVSEGKVGENLVCPCVVPGREVL